MLEKTTYGKKRARNGRFVLVAPHGAGDDLKTGIIAVRLAKVLKSTYIVNNKYKKNSNDNIIDDEFVEDFNRLRWGRIKNKYLWARKKPAMKEFYSDIEKKCEDIKKNNKKPVVVYLHAMKNDEVGIDIGVGLKFKKNRLFGAHNHFDFNFNTGEVTLKIGKAKRLKKFLESSLTKDRGLDVTIGEVYSGWSRRSAIQFHKNGLRNDYAMQLEINQYLRKDDVNINYLVDLLSRALINIFN